jgi:hypothetical protein
MKRSTIALAIQARDLHDETDPGRSWSKVAVKLGKDRSYLIGIVRELNALDPSALAAQAEPEASTIKGPPTFSDGRPMPPYRPSGSPPEWIPDVEWLNPPSETSNGGFGWQFRQRHSEVDWEEVDRDHDELMRDRDAYWRRKKGGSETP